jgi:hypothetical protein
VDAHALRRDLRIADGDEGAAGRRAQQVQAGQRAEHGDHQADEVEGVAAVGRPAEHLHRAHRLAGIAAGDAFPAREHFRHDEAEGQRRDAQVDAFHAQRRQAHDDADGRRQHRAGGQRQREGPAHAGEHRLRIGADAEEGGMADGEQAGEAGQQHQPEPTMP